MQGPPRNNITRPVPRYRARLKLAHLFTPAALARKRAEMAETLAEQTRERIAAQGDPDAPFPPKAFGGGPALLGLIGRVEAFDSGRGFGASIDGPFVRTLLNGGTIEAKNKKALAFKAGGVLRFFRRVTIPAREVFRLTAENVAELGRVFVGKGRRG